MISKHQDQRRNRKGATVAEFAILSPLLMLMMAGAADFARVFYNAITVAGASEIGSLWGSQSNVHSVLFTEINSTAEQDAQQLLEVTATSSIYCDCPDGTEVDCLEGTCTGYGFPRLYSRTRVQQSFQTMLPWPGVPNPVVVVKESYIRAQ